jgi:actin-related protein
MEVSSLVFDNGAYAIRAGVGGDPEPACIIPCIVGRPKASASGQRAKDFFIGADVFAQTDPLSLKCPIENRVVTNFEDMEKIWGYIFNTSLGLKPEEHPVLMTESPEKLSRRQVL